MPTATQAILSLDLTIYPFFRLILLAGPPAQSGFPISIFPFHPMRVEDVLVRMRSIGSSICGHPLTIRTESGVYPRVEISLNSAEAPATFDSAIGIVRSLVATLLADPIEPTAPAQ